MGEGMDKEFWRQHGLRRTDCRMAVVGCLEAHATALSAQSLREEIGEIYDRTTFYRTLLTLEERGVIHRIVADSEVVKYALNVRRDLTEQHAHFYCDGCKQVWCLTQRAAPRYALRAGFTMTRVDCVVHGLCAECAKLLCRVGERRGD